MPMRRSLLAALPALGLGLSGCLAGDGSGPTTTFTPGETPTPPEGADDYWYTHPRPTGNRYLGGSGAIQGADPVEFDVGGTPKWLVAHPAAEGSHWTVAAADGSATRWLVRDGEAIRVGEYDPLPAGTAPVVAEAADGYGLVGAPAGMDPRSSPTVVPGGEGREPKLLYVSENGDLVVVGEGTARLPVDAPPDARLAAIGDGRYAVFGDATDRYRHAALGDAVEGSSLVVVDPSVPEVTARASVGPPEVFEGLQPLVADLDGDGDPEVVATLADSKNGARMSVYDADANHLATGPVHEPGWRHQLLVAPTGPDGRPELAVVRKPHVDKLLEFYRLEGGDLTVAAELGSFSTHTYGSRILDGAVAGDVDGDGTPEVLLPTADRDVLSAVRREPGGASVAWGLDPGGVVRSNVTGIALADGRAAVGVGTDDGVRVWQG